MSQTINRRQLALGLAAMSAQLQVAKAGTDPDPAVMTFRLPKDLKFDPNKTTGNQQIVLFGNPNEASSQYGVYQKWYPHSMSRPHFHLHDRYIYVVSGTWWVGWGEKYDPDSTYPMVAGTFVHHFPRQLHYDGAKDEECVLIISGEGPAGTIPAAQINDPNAQPRSEAK